MTDPFAVLGVPEDAGDAAVRAAYVAAVERHPPDRDPEGFKAIRAAYEVLKDPRRRLELSLFGLGPPDRLADRAPPDAPLRHVGPDPWLRLIEEARR